MSRKVICQYCRKTFSRAEHEYEKTSKGFYHKSCLNTFNQEREKRTSITEFVQENTPGGQINYPLVAKQIKEFTEKYPYTESGILGTLHYMKNVKRMKLQPKTGIAIVPYLYNEARSYYEKLDAMGEVKKHEVEEVVVNTRQQKSKRLSQLIDIESLLEDDDF